jgi:hypothetical protein
VYYLSGDLILAYVKNYYEPCSMLGDVLNYYSSHKSAVKVSPVLTRKFIVESLKWETTSLTLKSRNLSIFETFLNNNSERLIVKFLNWLGDLKPLCFDGFELNYEEINLLRLKTEMNLKKKMASFVNILMDYPLKELKEIVFFFAGDESASSGDRLNTLYKMVKSLEYILEWGVALNENVRTSVKTYNQQFIEKNKENTNVIDKMRSYEYCEWKYIIEYPTRKLIGNIRRLERYNERS